MRSFKKKLLLYGVFAALYCVSGAARILDKAGARISTHFDTSINDLKELFKERFESASTEHKRLHENEHDAKKTLHNILECDKLTTLEHLVGDEVDCDHGEFATKWNILAHLLNKMESPLKEKNRNDNKETAKDVAEKILKLGKIVDFFIEKALKLDSMDLLKDLMKLRLIFHKKDKGFGKIGDWKKFVDEVIEIGTKLHKLEEKHEKDSDSENRKNIFEHLKDKDHGDFLLHIKEIEKLLTARGIAHETEHIAKKGKELKEKLVEGIKHVLEKNKIFHKIDNEGDFFKHVFEKVFKHDKKESKEKFVEDALQNEKKILEGAEHIVEKGKKIDVTLHGFEHNTEKLIKHEKQDILDKISEHSPEDEEEDDSHFFRHIKEIGEKIHELMHHEQHRGENIKHDLFEHIKNMLTKIFKIAETHKQKWDKVHISEFLHDLKKIGKEIPEMKEKHEEKEGKNHHGLFKYIEEVGKIIHHTLEKHDKNRKEDHVHHIKGIGEKLLTEGGLAHETKHLAEKEKEKIGEIIEHILDKSKIFHKTDNEGDFIKHVLEKLPKHDEKEDKDEFFKDTIEYGKNIVEGAKHLVGKGKKIENTLDGFEHITEKRIKYKKHKKQGHVFKHNPKDDGDDEGHFFRHIKQIGEKIHEIIHHIRHSGGDIKHDLFEHIEKIGTIIFKMVETHDKIRGKVHIDEFLQDLKDIKKVIHEIKEKHEEKEGTIHHGLFKYIEKVGKLIHHILEKHDKLRKEDHKGDVSQHIRHLEEKGNKVGDTLDGFEHITEELMKHKKHDHDEFHIFDKVFKHNSKDDEDDERHFFRHIKEIGEKIHEIIHHIRHSGGDIKHDLFKHIKKIGTIIFKIVELHDKIGGKVHIGEFLQDLKDIKKVIHEIREKHEEKEGKIHHGLFKYIEEVGELIHHILEKHDKIRNEDHKGDVFYHIKHLVEKEKKVGDTVDGFEHIIEKLIKHKKHDDDKFHIFDKVFKHNPKDDEDDEGHFFRHIKEIGEKIHEMIHHIRHSGRDIKHDLFEHIKKIGTIIFKIVEIHDKLGDKVHIGEFVQDLKDVKKVIHEIKQKHEEKECKNHHGLFKYIEEVGRLIHHILEKYDKMRKEDHKGAGKHHRGEFIEDTLEIGKNMFEDTKKVIKKGKQIDETVEGLKHELENEGDFIEHLLEKVFKHDKKDDEKHLIKNTLIKGTKLAEGIYHILKEKKELEKLLLIDDIKYLLDKGLNLSEIGDEGNFFKYLFDKLFKHIKNDPKEEFIVEKLEHGKEFFEGVKHVLEKEKETDEKLVEEFKHFMDKKEILDKVEKECDIIKHVIDKEEFIKDAIEGGKKFVVDKGKQLGKFAEDVKHVIEKGKEINEKLVDGFKHIIHKGNILHKLDYEGDFIKHLIEKELIEDALEGGKKLVEGFKHIKEKERKLHAFEHEGEFIKHVVEKVFKHDKKGDKEECIEDSIEEEEECFEDDIKEKLKEKPDAFKHFIEFVGAEHKGHFIKHLLEEKFEHGKDKIEEYLHRFGIKLHEVKEFFKDLMHKKHATLEKISDDIGSDEQKNAVHAFLKLIGSFDKGKIEKHDGREKEKLLSESKHVLHKVSAAVHSIETPLSHSGEFLKRILPKKKVVDCCPCECCCCGQDANNNCNQGGTSNQGFTYKAGEEFDELYSNPNYQDQGFYFG